METSAIGSPTTYYVHGNGLISMHEVETSASESNSEVRHYHYDSRGSTILLTNTAGAITDTIEYDIYGEILKSTGDSEF